jgi:hypothetical protein
MSAAETLRTLAAGVRPASGLLHTARLEAFGVEAYGDEAILESFRREPFAFSKNANVIQALGHIAICDESIALFADLYGDNIARIWRLGDGQAAVCEPGVSVAFDPDLAQARSEVFFKASDHPLLAPECVDAVIASGQRVLSTIPAYRARAFAIRAFGTPPSFAALFAVYRLSGDGVRTSGFSMAAAIGDTHEIRCVADVVGQIAVEARPWTPRISA